MKYKINELSKESLQKIILEMTALLSDEQCHKLEMIIDTYRAKADKQENISLISRMSQECVDEKMQQLEVQMKQIEEGELYLNTEEYEDYSAGYWDSEMVTDYYDNQGIGDIVIFAVQFAKDCVDERHYQEANYIYEWLWSMCVCTDCEYENEIVDLETLVDKDIVHIKMEQLALLTLYADYQVKEPEKRAEDLYMYFIYYPFQNLHIEDMFRAGRENLDGTEQFWKDWIALLETKNGDVEARLLQEAVLYHEGIEGLEKMADRNYKNHPSLYLAVMKEYDKNHDYARIEKIGERALEKIDYSFKIRSTIALKAAYAASCHAHLENVMSFCWEGFRSDSTVKTFLRLFGMKEMAEIYGMRGKEVLDTRIKETLPEYIKNKELSQNIIEDYTYYSLSFYTGNFTVVKEVSKNPKSSLGWSSHFIQYGVRLFLLYLFEEPLPSKAAASIASYVGFQDDTNFDGKMSFEGEIIEESNRHKISIFWNYFQRWKRYFPMEKEDKKKYFAWAENIVYERADAIVGGQYRNHYREVAVLLEMVAEIKEIQGEKNAKQQIFAIYKGKFPRHSSFQAEMKNY